MSGIEIWRRYLECAHYWLCIRYLVDNDRDTEVTLGDRAFGDISQTDRKERNACVARLARLAAVGFLLRLSLSLPT